MPEPILRVSGLTTTIKTRRGTVRPVNGVSFDLHAGESLALVGESGSGKSMTCLTLLRMVPKPGGRIVAGSVELNGRDILKLSEREMRRVRGREISMILQDPMTSLDPLFNVGEQVEEALPRSGGRRGLRQVIDLLSMVRIPAPEARRSNYPHQLSGGMRQRVVAAISLASEPAVLLADEPTTALDVTIQAQFLALLKDIRERRQLALILVTHDLSVVARACDRAAVMYAGRIVEMAPTRDLFVRPHHPYTQGLIGSVPRLGVNQRRLATIEGQPPDLVSLPTGCPFRARCPGAMTICETEDPPLRETEPGRQVACWLEPEAAAVLWRERQAATLAAREAAS